jgi:hypothetical protein
MEKKERAINEMFLGHSTYIIYRNGNGLKQKENVIKSLQMNA